MRPDGWYLINVIDKIDGGRFLASMVYTLQAVFDHVYVLSESDHWHASWASTYIVAASDAPLDLDRLAQVQGQGTDGRRITRVMPPERMEAWLAERDGVLLTDDYAPVDNLLAPLFLERGR